MLLLLIPNAHFSYGCPLSHGCHPLRRRVIKTAFIGHYHLNLTPSFRGSQRALDAGSKSLFFPFLKFSFILALCVGTPG